MPRLTLNDILAKPRDWIHADFATAANDVTAGRAVRIFRLMLASEFGGHFRIWNSLTAGSGDMLSVHSIYWYPAAQGFGPAGIRFDALSYDWGTNPIGSDPIGYYQGRDYLGLSSQNTAGSFGSFPSYDWRAMATILYAYDE